MAKIYIAPTTVVNVRGIGKYKRLLWQADPSFVYVGRNVRGYWKKSPWHNPWKVGMGMNKAIETWCKLLPGVPLPAELYLIESIDYPHGAVDWYRAYIERSPLRKRIKELRGKRLGCWCCPWRPGEELALDYGERKQICHAIVLAEMANARRRR